MEDGTDLRGVADIGSGSCHSCTLSSLGDGVYCWGCNNRSQLGRTTAQAAQSAVAVLVPSSSAARLLAVGIEQAHFFGSDMICGWGSNQGSPLSGAPTTTFAMPTCFSLASVQQPFLGYGFGCARLASGAVQCWGLQIGSSTIMSPPGMAVPGIVATTLGGGEGHACARDVNANLRCWGANSYGALGDGTTQDSTIPTTVIDAQGAPLANVLSGGIAISASSLHSCAIRSDGSLYCWGWNNMGQIGNGLRDTNALSATAVRW